MLQFILFCNIWMLMSQLVPKGVGCKIRSLLWVNELYNSQCQVCLKNRIAVWPTNVLQISFSLPFSHCRCFHPFFSLSSLAPFTQILGNKSNILKKESVPCRDGRCWDQVKWGLKGMPSTLPDTCWLFTNWGKNSMQLIELSATEHTETLLLIFLW